MKPITISLDLPLNPYSIHIDDSWQGLAAAIKPFVGNKVMIVSDENTKDLFYNEVSRILVSMKVEVSCVAVPPGEASKSLQVAENLYTQALSASLDRSSSILALGGGVVGDLAGFI